jgi:hypothetical protein
VPDPARAERFRFFGYMAEGLQTPGFVSGVTQGWLPLGGDMMTLLDACADGVPLSVDVHNARPLNMFTAFAYSGVEGGFSNTSLYAFPFNRARAFGNDSRGFCASGMSARKASRTSA